MKKFFIIVISLAVLTIAVYGIGYLVLPVTSMDITEYKQEVSIKCSDAFIVRNETAYYATASGTVYNTVDEGERVGRETVINTIYSGAADSSVLRRLHTLDAHINRLKKDRSHSNLYSNDAATVENEIAERLSEITALARDNNVEKIGEYRRDVNALRSGEDISYQIKIEELQAERDETESRIALGKTDILSENSGIFSPYVDGLENILTPENIKEFDAAYIRSLAANSAVNADGAEVSVGMPVGKVMDNHKWYVLGITDASNKTLFDENNRPTVRFSGLTGSSAAGKLAYISEPDDNGECIFLIEVPTYLESAFSYRKISAEIIFKEYTGYKVPIEAVRTGDSIDSYYVYAMQGSESYKCDCEVLYTDSAGGYSVIKSTEDAVNKLSVMERIVIGER